MQEHLKDIVRHTYSLGIIDTIKISGDQNETTMSSIAEDRSVILKAKFKDPVPEFIGTFGMPNLGRLNTILNIPEYKEDANFTISTRVDHTNATVPDGIVFTNKVGDFRNEYRFMGAEIINEKIKSIKFRDVKWNVDIVPEAPSIQRLKFQAAANSEFDKFTAKTENGALKFYFGDVASHAGNFVFANNVTGSLTKSWGWPLAAVLGILNLPGSKTFKISDEGAAMITVDSGIAEYSYIIPAKT